MQGRLDAHGAIGIYAGFWRRAFALLVDEILLICVALLGAYGVSHVQQGAPAAPRASMGLIVLALTLFYEPAFISSSLEATPGKRLLGMRVTGLRGERIAFARALVRFFSKLLSGLTLCIGYAMAAYTPRRQALHDRIAGTLVVRRAVTTAEIEGAGPAPHVSAPAAILITLGVVLFGPSGLGILAGIAIPAYQDLVMRAQVASGIEAVSRYQAAVARVRDAGTDLMRIDTASLHMAMGEGTSPFVGEIAVQNGVIILQFGAKAAQPIRGTMLLFVPALGGDGSLHWVCGHGPSQGTSVLPLGQLDPSTTTPSRLLPQECRSDAR